MENEWKVVVECSAAWFCMCAARSRQRAQAQHSADAAWECCCNSAHFEKPLLHDVVLSNAMALALTTSLAVAYLVLCRAVGRCCCPSDGSHEADVYW